MFVCTFKWNKRNALIIIIAAVALLCAIVLIIGRGSGEKAADRVRNNDDRIAFLQSLGWDVAAEPICEKDIIIPKDFSEIYEAYNELQKAQGYDFSDHCGLEVTIFTYSLNSYSGYNGKVVADLYVLNFEVIGGDVHSLEMDGFMHGLKASK